MWYKNVDTSFFRFVTIHAFDRQTDRHFAHGYDRAAEMHKRGKNGTSRTLGNVLSRSRLVT